MPRYIDADALVKRLKHSPLFLGTNMQFKDGVIDLVERQLVADVVEVVRCKDCVYRMELSPIYQYEGRSCKVCFIRNKPVSDDGYCNEAIRKEDE